MTVYYFTISAHMPLAGLLTFEPFLPGAAGSHFMLGGGEGGAMRMGCATSCGKGGAGLFQGSFD